MTERHETDYSMLDEQISGYQTKLDQIDRALDSVNRNITLRKNEIRELENSATDELSRAHLAEALKIDKELEDALQKLELEKTSIAAELDALRQRSQEIKLSLSSFDSDIKH